MSIENIKKKLRENSKVDTTWIEKAQWRQDNEAWLDISFKIALETLSKLDWNKKHGKHPKSQKELAQVLECSPQYVNKLVKGKERLQIDTITRLEAALNISLIQLSSEHRITDGLSKEQFERSKQKKVQSEARVISFAYDHKNEKGSYDPSDDSPSKSA